jgi:type IV pilus assembly protein PilC
LGLTLASGISLSESLHITATVTKNSVYKKAYYIFSEQVLTGENISTIMNTHYATMFTDILPHMIHIGETTGTLSETLQYLSDLYEADVDEHARNLSNALEPMLLTIMGILVGIIAISIIVPIYEITKHISTMR